MQDSFLIAVLLGYIFAGCTLVIFLRGIRGIMACLVIGWIFLPPSRGINLPGLPMFTKEYAVAYAVLLGVLISDSGRLLSFRPRLIDLPILFYIISPFPSSVTNGLGAYDGLSGIYSNIFNFGLPYLLGRIYIRNPNDVKKLAIWFMLAGLIAAPFALWESRMSPNLNYHLYGYHPAQYRMSMRLGGYRPTLFMRHGLEVGLWLATSAAVGLWLMLVASKTTKLFNFPVTLFSLALLGTSILSRSLGAIILLFGTSAAAVVTKTTGLRIILIALVLTPPVYLSVRIANIWSPTQVTAVLRAFDAERADSLEARLEQEISFSQHALKKPVFGWGGYNRFRPVNELGKTGAVDGLTTIVLGENGLLGLISFLGLTTLPGLVVLLRLSGKAITSEIWAPAIALILGLSIFSIDMMFNSFFTPIHILALGALATVGVQIPKWQQVIRQHQIAVAAEVAQPNPQIEPPTNQDPPTPPATR